MQTFPERFSETARTKIALWLYEVSRPQGDARENGGTEEDRVLHHDEP
jgi:hypothetical protein